MKIFLFVVISFLLSSCTVSKIHSLSEEKLNEAVIICAANGGVDKIHLDGSEYLAKCANNAYVGNSESVDKLDEYVTKEELKECTSLCLHNDGVSKINVSRSCEDVKSAGKALFCTKNKDSVTCHCKNNVYKEYNHIVD